MKDRDPPPPQSHPLTHRAPSKANQGAREILSSLQAALGFHHRGELGRAESLYRHVLKLDPKHSDALHLLGVIAHQQGNSQRAVELIQKSLRSNPNNAAAHNNLGNALNQLRRHQSAIECFDRAIALNPGYAEAYNNRGVALNDLEDYQAAIGSYDKALALKHDYSEAYSNRAVSMFSLNDYQGALASCERALAINPTHAESYNNRGLVFHRLKQRQKAIDDYERAISIRPNYAKAYINLGVELIEARYYLPAIESLDRALSIDPESVESHFNRGLAFSLLGQPDQASISYQQALARMPSYPLLYGTVLHTKMQLCDWQDFEGQTAELFRKLRRGDKSTPPFYVLALTDSLEIQKKSAEIFVADQAAEFSPPASPRPRKERAKIAIGYYSSDFYNHATSYLIAELLENHDHEQFSIIGFSFGPVLEDEMRRRIVPSFDEFHEVGNVGDADVALMSRNLQIDVAVDLKGYTNDHRIGIFARRAADVQVNYLGYPGTMGASFIDYIIADPMLIPSTNTAHFSEKIVYLPNSYQPNDSKRKISAQAVHRGEYGLPESGFVFCCFNNSYKITPDRFDLWMRILKSVDTSVLWLLEDKPIAVRNLKKEAAARGVEPNRLIFAPRAPLPDHLARHRLADLFLDTLPYNAHTTASDALWAGLPVLTQAGNSFAGRVAASLLNAVGLPELIATSAADYEALAVELAKNREKLAAIRYRLENSRLTAPLFDTVRYTRDLEAAYRAMVERQRQGLSPDHIFIR